MSPNFYLNSLFECGKNLPCRGFAPGMCIVQCSDPVRRMRFLVLMMCLSPFCRVLEELDSKPILLVIGKKFREVSRKEPAEVLE